MNKRYTVQHRRKREGKTNYKKRLNLLKSSQLRLVVRGSNKNILAQLVEFEVKGDKVIISAHSNDIVKLGWKFNSGNIPAAYLVGFLAGKKAKKKGIAAAILDVGMYQPVKGSRVYAALKGALDAGITIPHSAEILPSEDTIKGTHIKKFADLSKKDGLYEKRFAIYEKEKVDLATMPTVLEQIKKKIDQNA